MACLCLCAHETSCSSVAVELRWVSEERSGEHEAVWSCFMRLGETTETGGSQFPRVGLERRNKNRVLIKGKSNSHLIFLLYFSL